MVGFAAVSPRPIEPVYLYTIQFLSWLCLWLQQLETVVTWQPNTIKQSNYHHASVISHVVNNQACIHVKGLYQSGSCSDTSVHSTLPLHKSNQRPDGRPASSAFVPSSAHFLTF